VKRFVAPALIIVFAFLTFPRPGGGPRWFTPVPSLREMESQVVFGLQRLARDIQFQTPEMSPFSIPYLTMREVREAARNLQRLDDALSAHGR
jgi:hypothetical protein